MIKLLENDKNNELLAHRIEKEMRWEQSINEEVGVIIDDHLYVCVRNADGFITVVEKVPLCQ